MLKFKWERNFQFQQFCHERLSFYSGVITSALSPVGDINIVLLIVNTSHRPIAYEDLQRVLQFFDIFPSLVSVVRRYVLEPSRPSFFNFLHQTSDEAGASLMCRHKISVLHALHYSIHRTFLGISIIYCKQLKTHIKIFKHKQELIYMCSY